MSSFQVSRGTDQRNGTRDALALALKTGAGCS